MTKRAQAFVAIAVGVVVLDQWTKWLAVAHLTRAFRPVGGTPADTFGERLWRFLSYRNPQGDRIIAVLDDFWHFRYVQNPGAAWGLFANSPDWFRTSFLLLVSIAAMVFIVFYFRRTESKQGLLRVALALVFGGALGNFLDRVRLGYVIDFIDWHWYNKATWPTFNIADAAISVGVAFMILDMILHRPSTPAESRTAANNGGASAS